MAVALSHSSSRVPFWASLILAPDAHLIEDEFGILHGSKPKGDAIAFHDDMPKGAALRELQYQPLHLAWWEAPLYSGALSELVSNQVPREGIVLDLGCGDGRFTIWLLEQGFDRIVALDPHPIALRSLADELERRGEREKVVLICSGAEDAPFQPGSVDLILAIGVLYYFNEGFESALKQTASWLKPSGEFVVSLPSKSGASILALLFEGVNDFLFASQNSRWHERHGPSKSWFRAFSPSELDGVWMDNDLVQLDRHPMSILPLLVRVMMVRGQLDADEIAQRSDELRQAFAESDANGEFGGLVLYRLKNDREVTL